MTLSAEQRREQIIKNIQQQGKVKVAELSREFGISEVTIRNDLELLESQGQLNRVHGGAVGVNPLYGNMNLNERYNTNVDAKKALAEKVAELVEDNDTIMMNAGTTLTYVLHALQGKKNISIVTNSIQNANEINSSPSFNVILLGGQIDARYQFTFGHDTICQLENYHANKCILSLDGINLSYGLSLYYANEASTIRKMMELSGTVIVAADSSKLGKNTFTKIAPVDQMDILVTNRSDKTEEIQMLKDEGIIVYEA